MKNIIIVGYPKSGNTWITRLTAELVGCPVKGFWNYPEMAEIAQEGKERISEFQCFKAHQQLHKLNADVKNDYIIYVMRDPRDIAISGAHYFKFHRINNIDKMIKGIPKAKDLYYRFIYNILSNNNYRIWQMIKTVLHGNEDIYWCDVSWKNHFKPYLDSGVLFIKYEDMLQEPEKECGKIADYLNLKKDMSQIKTAIKKQSFQQKKKEFIQQGNETKLSFMRSGKISQWKNNLTDSQKNVFIKHLYKELKLFSFKN